MEAEQQGISSSRQPSLRHQDVEYNRSGKHRQENITRVGVYQGASQTITENDVDKGNKPSLNWKKLNELLQKEPNDLLLSLLCPKLGFLNLLSSSETRDHILIVTMKVIARACLSEHARSALLEFLRQVNDSCFLKQAFVQYLGNLLANGKEQTLDAGLTMASLFLFENLLTKLPSKSMPIVTLLLTQMKVFIMHGSPNEQIQDAVRQIEEIMEYNQKQIQMGSLMRDQENVQNASWDPKEKFRRLSVLPTSKDLHGQRDPYLSKNIIYGKYKNVSNYLDVQFRLLREDLIRPLREGLAELLEWKKHRHNNRMRTDLKLYTKVHIISINFSTNELVYKVTFDMKHLRNVVWERSKRLNYGSLVCLSPDEFQTIIVATVAERDNIRHGEILLQFQNEENRQEIDLRPEISYEMIESPAYFVAYKPVLEGLQFMDEYSVPVPFVSYLLNQRQKDEPVPPPRYLLRNSRRYDFTSITKGQCEHISDPQNFKTWPSSEQLGLDFSQYNALRSALTKEFALIQGPPGTGKTFIGLKIVQVLLANELVWNSINTRDAKPILIVCFTNHALDQFLELILDSELIEHDAELLRIGSRSKSEKLACHNIKEIKRKGSYRYGGNRHTALDKMQELRNKIIPLAAYIELSKEQIFEHTKLQIYMIPGQMKSLLSRRVLNESIFITWLMNNNANPDELLQLVENAEIDLKIELEPEFDDVGEDDREDAKDSNLNNKQNFKETKSNILLSGDFLIEDSGRNGNKIRKLRMVYRTFRDIMPETEARNCVNVWTLTPVDRWRLYNYWVSQHVEPDIQRMTDMLAEHNTQNKIVKEIEKEEDYQVMRSAKIIGLTTTGSARYRDILQRLQPKIIIVEEAAEVLEAHIVTSLSIGCEHLILIGDHQQLRRNSTVYELAKDYHLNISLFERMVLNELHCERLTIQHRMRPEIVELIVPHIYKTLINADSVLLYENVWGILGNIFFLNHSIEEQCADDGQSHSNLHEAKFMSALCRYFIEVGYEPSQITVLTTYTGQMFLLRKHMPKASFDGVRVTPVDNYQGEENDIILLSLVRSNKNGNIGFLKIPNRVCVALSRAKKGCFIIGNGNQLTDGSILWHDILASLKKCNRFVDSLPLACHKHPKNVNHVSNDLDFKLVPHGGCAIPCDYRLECGHVCNLNCHHYDLKHEKYKCKKDCARSCPVGHPCIKQCYIECGNCTVLVQKTLSRCEHMHLLHCFVDEKDVKCKKSCRKSCDALSHSCPKKCFEDCGDCIIPVEKSLTRCGHTEMVLCYLPENKHLCQRACSKSCSSGHSCKKLCFEDCENCIILMEKLLTRCGHVEVVPCYLPENQYKCQKACPKTCSSDHPCKQLCFEECENCEVLVEKILPLCQHVCLVPCYLPPHAFQCKMPCDTVCPNGHPCDLLCYEACKPCDTLVEKELSRCHHLAMVPCSTPEEFHKCKSPCPKLCSSDHPCIKSCYEDCGDCIVPVEKKISRCNHMAIMPCSKLESSYKCLKPCEKLCKRGHSCVNVCGEVCDHCEVDVDKILPICKHIKRMSCWKLSLSAICSLPCEKRLKCSHSCTKLCGETCTSICQVIVPDVLLPCMHRMALPCSTDPKSHRCLEKVTITLCEKEHTKIVACHESSLFKIRLERYKCDAKIPSTCNSDMKHELEIPCYQQTSGSSIHCNKVCNFKQSCGHKCAEKCCICTSKKKHESCKYPCTKILPLCSHCCLRKCSEACPPCTFDCEQACRHRKCRHRCSEPCLPCHEPCDWTCPHHICQLTCSEPCTREACNEPCRRKLWCKHQCQGLCGEPCPDKCFLCSPKYVKALEKDLNGFVISKSTKFLQLRPCGDVIPVEYMDNWVKQSTKNPTTAVKSLREFLSVICPIETCKREVEYCPRYNALIKRLSLSQAVAKSKIKSNKYENFNKAKKTWEKFSQHGENFNDLQVYSRIDAYALWLWNECRLQRKHMSDNDKISYVKIYKKINEEQEFVDNVKLGDAFETCHPYVYNEERLSTDAEMDAHCPTCHSIEEILSTTLLWLDNKSTAEQEQKAEQELSIEAVKLSNTATSEVQLEITAKALYDVTEENKGARPKIVSSAKQWTLENMQQTEVAWNLRGQRGAARGRRPFQRGHFDQRGQQSTTWQEKEDGWRPHNEFQNDNFGDWRNNKQKYNSSDNGGRWGTTERGARSNRRGYSGNVSSGFRSMNPFERETTRNDNLTSNTGYRQDGATRFEQTENARRKMERTNQDLRDIHHAEELQWGSRGQDFDENFPMRRRGTNPTLRSRGMNRPAGRGYRGRGKGFG